VKRIFFIVDSVKDEVNSILTAMLVLVNKRENCYNIKWVIVMSYMLNMGLWRKIFAVPAELVTDEKLRMCGAAQLKILLYLLREGEADPEKIAASLRMTPGDVADALDYWVAEGILTDGKAVGTAITVNKPNAAVQESSGKAEAVGRNAAETTEKAERIIKPLSAPPVRLNAREMKELAARPDVAFMLEAAEAMLGKTFTSTDTSTLLWLTSWAGISPEVLLTVISYCAEIGKTRMSYIQATAVAWMNDGVETAEQAEKYLKEVHAARNYENVVRGAFGLYDRALTSKEKSIVAAWSNDGFGQPLLIAAYERTIEAIGKLSFNYINKILLSWKEKGITTPEQADAERKVMRDNRKLETSYDIGEIESLFNDDIMNVDF